MSVWLDPIGEALDNRMEPVRFFFRDDDAGWAEQRLFALLDCFARTGLPIDLAVIPRAITGNATALYHRVIASDGSVGVHQHGFSHRNHQLQGRKCEFGDARTCGQQWLDIKSGRDILNDAFAGGMDAIFTPPWNRCSQNTADVLLDLGFTALSRDVTAKPLQCRGLQELPVSTDWFRKVKGVRLTASQLGRSIAQAIADGGKPVGLMLQDHGEREKLSGLLELLACHPMAHCRRMQDLLERQVSISRP